MPRSSMYAVVLIVVLLIGGVYQAQTEQQDARARITSGTR